MSQLVEHIWAVNAWLIVFWRTPHWSAFEDEDGPSMTAIIHYLSPLISRITCSHLGPLGRLLPSVANPFPRPGCPILLIKTNTKNLTNLVKNDSWWNNFCGICPHYDTDHNANKQLKLFLEQKIYFWLQCTFVKIWTIMKKRPIWNTSQMLYLINNKNA